MNFNDNSNNEFDYSTTPSQGSRHILYFLTVIFLSILAIVLYIIFIPAPSNFQDQTIASVDEGKTLKGIAADLKDQNIIKSELAFQSFAILFGGDRNVIAGEYLFENKVPVYIVASRIVHGDRHIRQTKITFPEGFTTAEMNDTLVADLPGFISEDFLRLSAGKQGYLFPDTYFFFPKTSAEDIVKALSDNYTQKTEDLVDDIATSGHSEDDIIIMASIIEKEAFGDEDREIISGILWNRIKAGIALQVDAVPDTYKYAGLPDEPISNPGLEAITAAIHPGKTPYLFYLHDKNGKVHYARNFEEHKKNKLLYL